MAMLTDRERHEQHRLVEDDRAVLLLHRVEDRLFQTLSRYWTTSCPITSANRLRGHQPGDLPALLRSQKPRAVRQNRRTSGLACSRSTCFLPDFFFLAMKTVISRRLTVAASTNAAKFQKFTLRRSMPARPCPYGFGMSACPRQRRKSGRRQRSDLGHVWTAPGWQELSSRLQHWSVQPCVRPLDAVHMTAGHNALRGSGPGQKHAFDNAVAQVGCPDRRIDRLCITCCSPSQPSHHAGVSGAISFTPQARRVPCSARPWPSSPRPSGRACWRARWPRPWWVAALATT